MDIGIDVGEGSCAGPWGELTPGVQVQPLFGNMVRGGTTSMKEHLVGELETLH
jgi:hypothetical protein